MWRSIYHELLRWAKLSRRTADGYKRTEIIVETDQILVLRKARFTRGWCAECGREVEMVTLIDAITLSGRAPYPRSPKQCFPVAGTAGDGIGHRPRMGHSRFAWSHCWGRSEYAPAGRSLQPQSMTPNAVYQRNRQ